MRTDLFQITFPVAGMGFYSSCLHRVGKIYLAVFLMPQTAHECSD